MAPEKVTEMVLNVDLKCSGCYKKVKKVITKIPQITDQVFDVDKNKVKIKVVCCDPERIRDKLCYKGCGSIQSIEIIEKPKEADKPKPPADKPKEADKPKPAADKPKEAEKPKPAADKPKEAEKPKPVAEKPKEAEKPKTVADKPKEAEKPKAVADKPKEAEKPKPPPAADKPKEPEKPKPAPAADKPKEAEKPKPADKPKDSANPPEAEKAKPKEADKPSPPKEVPTKPDTGPNPEVAKMVYEPVPGYPHMYPPSGYPMVGYGQHYDPYYGGVPYQHGYGTPPPPPPPNYSVFAYENEYNGYHGNRGHYTSNDYGGEEDGEGCSIM